MLKSRWQKIEHVFKESLLIPHSEQPEYIRRECGNDLDLYREIILLLDHDFYEHSFLDYSPYTKALHLLDSDINSFSVTSDFAGKYKLKKLIGRGATGLIYLAEDAADIEHKRPVAIKILPSFIFSHETLQCFRQEILISSRISHLNVAAIYEYGETEENYYLVMEYVKGTTLRELIKNNLIDSKLALEIVRQIVAGLTAVHSAGIAHLDIKPENIVLTDNNLLKILDFGNSRILENKPAQKSSSQSHLISGTAAYMSPEQIQGQPTDQTSDIWNLGIVLYEILSGGIHPFSGNNSKEIKNNILRKKTPLPPAAVKCQSELLSITQKCLQKNRRKRYQTCFDLEDDLSKLFSKISSDAP